MARVPVKDTELKKYNFDPVQRVLSDYYEPKLSGRLYHSIGIMDTKEMYSGGCIFSDHTIGHFYVVHNVSLNTMENFRTNITFERE